MAFPGPSSSPSGYDDAIKFLTNEVEGFADALGTTEDQRFTFMVKHLTQKVVENEKTKKYCDLLSRDLQLAHNAIDALKVERNKSASQITALSRELEINVASLSASERMREEFRRLVMDYKALEATCFRYRTERDAARAERHDPNAFKKMAELEEKTKRLAKELEHGEVSRLKLTDFIVQLRNDNKELTEAKNDALKQIQVISSENVRLVGFRQRSDQCVDKLSKQCFKLNTEKQNILTCFESILLDLSDFFERNGIIRLPERVILRPPKLLDGKSRKRKAPGRVCDIKPDLLNAYKELIEAKRINIKPTTQVDVVAVAMREDEIKMRGMATFVESGLAHKIKQQSIQNRKYNHVPSFH